MHKTIIKVLIVLVALTALFFMCDGPWHVRNMFTLQAKARQSEAKTNLASIATAQNSYFEKMKQWGADFKTLDWKPYSEHPVYAYFLTPTEHIGRPLAELGLSLPVDFAKYGAPDPGFHPTMGFTVVAIGNVDKDETLDVWIINQERIPKYTLNDVGN